MARTPTNIRIARLTTGDVALARETFALMAEVFEEDVVTPLSDAYVARLLAREDFWALAAVSDDRPVGGLTAHALPMTRAQCTELFIYDLAVHESHQRQGIGGALVKAVREGAAAAGMTSVFVPADNEDVHALDFYRAIGGEESPVTFFTFD